MFITCRRICRLIALPILAATLLAGPLSATMASAALATCRTDPIVLLSNGKQLNIVATVTDTAADIQKIAYAVHVPSGVGVSKITYTGGSFASKEVVTVYADDKSGTYDIHTVLTTSSTRVAITSTVTGYSSGKSLASGSTSGVSGQDLLVHLTF